MIVNFWVLSFIFALDTLVLVYVKDGLLLTALSLFYFVIVISVQSLLLYFASFTKRPKRLKGLLFAGLSSINLVSFKLMYSQGLLYLSWPLKLLVFLLISYLLYQFIKLEGRVVRRILIFVLVGWMVMIPLQRITDGGTKDSYSLYEYSDVELKEKPNVHVVFIDAMIPEAIAKKYMGIDADYAGFLRDSSIVIKNAFSVHVPTMGSIMGFLRLDDDRFKGIGYFSGTQLGPVYAIFKKNGYHITSGFSSKYFGPKGDYIDHYNVNNQSFMLRATTMCLDAESKFLKIRKFWDICRIKNLEKVAKELRKSALFKDGSVEKPLKSYAWPTSVRDVIVGDGKINRPRFTMHYIYTPIGHASNTLDSSDKDAVSKYVKFFDSQARKLSDVLKALKEDVLKSDPNAIVMVSGDHGAYLSRSVKRDEDPAFFYQDRHAVSLSLLKTDNRCLKEKGHLLKYSQGPSTSPSRVFAGIIRCLASDPATVDSAVRFPPMDKFDKYIYE